MNIEGKTLAAALRLRSTLANKIAQASNRAQTNAVCYVGENGDFNYEEQIASFVKEQANLRSLKTQTALKSLLTKIKVPEGLPVEESGKEIPVYQAVLVRDDLKSYKMLLERISNIPIGKEYDRFAYRAPSTEVEIPEKIRNFSFQETLDLIEKIQDAIDTIDGLIQATDATVKFE